MARVVNDLGMHLRAAGAVVQVAGRFKAEIWLEHDGNRVNGKSIMSVLSLAAARGAEISVQAEGADAQEAVDAIILLIQHGFSMP
ncbi:MAG: HPr family phosphocarrier protein [Deltaproteobacteria bacterium]|nr:HPr family phosphocarrier protein [Deltaproteobacteria bacterium]